MLSQQRNPGEQVLELVNRARIALEMPTLRKLPSGIPETSQKCVLGRSLDAEILLNDQDWAYVLLPNYRASCRLARAWRVERPCAIWNGWAVSLPEVLNRFVHEFDARCYPELSSAASASEDGTRAELVGLRLDWTGQKGKIAHLIERARQACHQTQEVQTQELQNRLSATRDNR